ncbi:MAG TPA: cobalamin B12-binding domain-containing protein, partial [Candidatus Sabulitectum sp.]|nr:cobalamin B12-binding domain-containing protein [Candidatus Sabulitectum sp.]
MRILLVQSFLGRRQHPVLPAGILSIAGALRGHDLMVADPNLHSSPMEYLRGILGSFRPDAVGISLRNCDTTSYTDRFSYLPAFARQVELIRDVIPGVHLVAGGAGFSLFAEDIMGSIPGIDCGVAGHGEALAQSLFQDRLTGLHRGGSGMIAHPALDLVKMEDYLPFQRNLSLGVEVNRGCDRDCAYCAYGEIS